MPYAEIAVPVPLYTTFTYSFDESLPLKAGMRVVVPFGKRQVVGLCIKVFTHPKKDLGPERIKPVEEILDNEPSASAEMLKLIEWMSSYYQSPIGEVVRATLPVRLLKVKVPKTTSPTSPRELSFRDEKRITLCDDQLDALRAIVAATEEGHSKVFLLHGVTGSGKTEVYLDVFDHLAKMGRQGLLLVPEIGLTPQLTQRMGARFGNRVAVYHSGLTDAQRHAEWKKMMEDEVSIVVGTRSALFAPLKNLGAIVVDEEHDGSYKQDEGFTYNARDAAVMRASIEKIPIVLGSATPSLESLANTRNGKYEILELRNRIGEASMPVVEIVDMRKRPKFDPDSGTPNPREFCCLSGELYKAIGEALSAREQVLLYMGKRGFAGAMQCGGCGEVLSCPNCDISLTAHGGMRNNNEYLTCHYCDYRIPVPDRCPSCGFGDLLPMGYGTERLEAEIEDFFPEACIARLDSDAAGTHSKRRGVLEDMKKGKIDILIGTQMVTKGHDFPSITLVGVIAADMTLSIPDFRSAERTFQVITQVAGRAGRGARPGRVIIQTRRPEHYSLIAASKHDMEGFSSMELKHRKDLCYPPFSRIANIRITANKKDMASKASHVAADILNRAKKGAKCFEHIKILGPAPAVIEKLRGKYRWQILIKAPQAGQITAFLKSVQPMLEEKVSSLARYSINVDPVNIL